MTLSPAAALLQECGVRGVQLSPWAGGQVLIRGRSADVDELSPQLLLHMPEISKLLAEWSSAIPPATLREQH